MHTLIFDDFEWSQWPGLLNELIMMTAFSISTRFLYPIVSLLHQALKFVNWQWIIMTNFKYPTHSKKRDPKNKNQKPKKRRKSSSNIQSLENFVQIY